MQKPLQLTKDLGDLYQVRGRNDNPITTPLPFEDAKEIFDALNHDVTRSELVEALKLHKEVFDELFAHCCSNGVFNAWNKPFDCTKLNEANHKTERLLKSENLYEHQWLCRFGASMPSPLSVLEVNRKSWVYVRGHGVFYVQPSHHNLFLAGMLALKHWETLGHLSLKQAEWSVSSDNSRASDLFMCITPGVMIKSSVYGAPLMVSPGELTEDETEFLREYGKTGLVDVLPVESPEYIERLRTKFKKK